MSAEIKFEKAIFVIREANAGAPKRNSFSKADSIEVKFNPTSLQYVITNEMKDPSKGNKKKQYVSKSTAKLTMDLVFDTTDEGADVRIHTHKIAKLMQPDTKKNNAPPVVLFAWGNFMFQGMVDGFKETIDFFSANGIPLRSSVNVSMSQQDDVFQDIDTTEKFLMPAALDAVDVPASANQSPASTAAQGGNSYAARDIAASNGLESTRFGSGAPMTVGKSVQLKPPLAFASGGASAGAGLSLSGGAGLSLGGGAGAGFSLGGGAGAGLSLGGGAGAGLSLGGAAKIGGGISMSSSIGGSASAGVSASEGAFAGLRVSANAKSSPSLDPSRLIRRSESSSLSTDAGASFSVGGKATVEGSSSLKADVGAKADLRARIQFDEK